MMTAMVIKLILPISLDGKVSISNAILQKKGKAPDMHGMSGLIM